MDTVNITLGAEPSVKYVISWWWWWANMKALIALCRSEVASDSGNKKDDSFSVNSFYGEAILVNEKAQ